MWRLDKKKQVIVKKLLSNIFWEKILILAIKLHGTVILEKNQQYIKKTCDK